MYGMFVDIVPIVIGYSGVMTVRCQQFLQRIPQFTTMQSTVPSPEGSTAWNNPHLMHSICKLLSCI